MGDILKEAIADAKAVRETALQNAKMALEEAFTPQLKSMLSAKLKEDELEEGDPVFEDEEGEDEDDAEEGYHEGEHGEDDEEAEEGAHEGEHGEDDEEAEEGVYEDEEDEDEREEEGLELEDIIRELEAELSEEAEIEEGEEPVEETVDESEETVDESEEPVEEEYEITLEGEDDDDKEEVDEEYDKSSGIGKSDNSVDKVSSSGIGSGKKGMKESLESELNEYKEAVKFLKDKLHEVNILNAKLLFTNKLFKEFSLDNNQKLRVVETFDRAHTTREIKLVYSTLCEQFGDNGSIKRKSINESASSAVSSTKPSKESKKVITEEQEVANRFKKLAGLI